jgi:divalent metal cation (Fe/Co/Zn/Cd) transporter
MALLVAILLCFTGFKLVRRSSQALLDVEDPALLEQLIEIINGSRPVDIITIHEMRTLRSGRYTHVDIHMVIPEFYEIGRAHDLAEGFGKQVIDMAGLEGELHTHIDPCQRSWCSRCGVTDCPIRQEPHSTPFPLTLEAATGVGPI